MADAVAFLSALWGERAPAGPTGRPTQILIWHKAPDGRRVSYYSTTPGTSAAHAERCRVDVYVGVSLAPRALGSNYRVKNVDAAGIAGLWADIDVAGGPEEKKRPAAPNVETALEVANAHLEPTLLVWSGYGLQAWWLLDDGPWIFHTPADREQAARLAAGWIALHDHAARQRGFELDPTQDLARVMRVPGTVNGKGGLEALVRGYPDPIDEQDGPRYPLDALAELALTVQPIRRQQSTAGQLGFTLTGNLDPPYSKMEALLANSDQFKRTWDHTRRDREAKDWTLSEYDLSLASQAAEVGWPDDEVAALIIAHRRHHGDVDKALREDYVARTIARARTRLEDAKVDRDRDEALDDLKHAASNGTADPSETIATFNRLLPPTAPPVKELVKDGREPGEARYTLVLSNADVVRLGGGRNLIEQKAFQTAFMDVTSELIPTVKRPQWEAAVQALLKVAVVRESDDDRPEGIVAEWLRGYLYDRLPPKPGTGYVDHACQRNDPFVDDDHVHVYASAFGAYVRNARRINVNDQRIKEMLRAAGFERQTVHYEREDGSRSTKSYYRGPAGIVE